MKRTTIFLTCLGLLIVITSVASAQSGSGASTPLRVGYDLTWNVIAGGGDTSTGGGYSLMGTIGQADTGPLMSGGGYSLAGGFWANGSSHYRVYLPVVLK